MDHNKDLDPEKGSLDDGRHVESLSSSDNYNNQVDRVNTVTLYEGGKVNLIPMPTSDPKDPLNLPVWQKTLAIISLCLFGAMAAAAEIILGAMLPVFDLVYAGLDPKILNGLTLPESTNALETLKELGGPPIWRVFLLASLPVLMMGLSNFFLVPLAISVGRRPVVLVSGCIAIGGAVWAGHSTSLNSHLGARAIQAIGAGTVESLIPFIISDMVFLHERNKAISGVFACQGLLIVGLGIASPYIVINLTWRWLYFITAIAAGAFWICVFFIMPETRYYRSSNEMKGVPREPLPPGENRPFIDTDHHSPRSYQKELRIFSGPMQWKRGVQALGHTLQTFFYPHILFVTLLNSIMIASALAAGYTVAPGLLTEPYAWPFLHLGFLLVTVLIAAIAVYVITGLTADLFANMMAKKRGQRDPEFQALNLIIPTVVGFIGTIIFGVSGNNPEKFGWPVFLTGLGFIAFGFLGTNTIGIVYVLECYPHLAGPALINIGSFRSIIAFLLTFDVSEWIAGMGYLKTFGIYAGVMGAFILFIPIIFVFGPGWRKRWPGPVERVDVNVVDEN